MKEKILIGIVLWWIALIYIWSASYINWWSLVEHDFRWLEKDEIVVEQDEIVLEEDFGELEQDDIGLDHDVEVVSDIIDISEVKYEDIKEVCFDNDNCLNIDLALTQEKRQIWLMWVHDLAIDRWMLFVFDQMGIYPFWMKWTLIDLDIIWIDDSWTIVSKTSMTICESDPCHNYYPNEKSIMALEMNAGLIEKFDIELGDKVVFIAD